MKNHDARYAQHCALRALSVVSLPRSACSYIFVLLLASTGFSSPPAFPTNWFEVAPIEQVSSDKLGVVAHTIEALGMMQKGSESFLAITGLSGRVKFLPNTPSEPDARPLAYEISVKAPAYKQGGIFGEQPVGPQPYRKPEEVFGALYDFYFEFALKDAEGFVLERLQSDKGQWCHQIGTRIEKETAATFKGVTTNSVSSYVAEATKTIECRIGVFRVIGDSDQAPE
jgi:hypothetical protein